LEFTIKRSLSQRIRIKCFFHRLIFLNLEHRKAIIYVIFHWIHILDRTYQIKITRSISARVFSSVHNCSRRAESRGWRIASRAIEMYQCSFNDIMPIAQVPMKKRSYRCAFALYRISRRGTSLEKLLAALTANHRETRTYVSRQTSVPRHEETELFL